MEIKMKNVKEKRQLLNNKKESDYLFQQEFEEQK